jgi:hypothetical protein
MRTQSYLTRFDPSCSQIEFLHPLTSINIKLFCIYIGMKPACGWCKGYIPVDLLFNAVYVPTVPGLTDALDAALMFEIAYRSSELMKQQKQKHRQELKCAFMIIILCCYRRCTVDGGSIP